MTRVFIPMPGEPGALAELDVEEPGAQLATQGYHLTSAGQLAAEGIPGPGVVVTDIVADDAPLTLEAFHALPFGSVTPRHVVLAVEVSSAVGEPGVREITAVLLSGGIADYAVYIGAGAVEWVADHGNKIPFELAVVIFPGIEERRYRP